MVSSGRGGGLCFAHGGWQADAGKGGLVRLDFEMDGALRNFIDKDATLGEFRLITAGDYGAMMFPTRTFRCGCGRPIHCLYC